MDKEGNKAAMAMINRRLAEERNTLMARAAIWRDAIAGGSILTFRAASGRALTVGPYVTADGRRLYACLEHGGSRREHYSATPWPAALAAVEMCGRVRPEIIA